MNYDSVYFLKDLVIVLLLFAMILSLRKNRELKEKLADESRKRSMPLISFEVNTDANPGLFLMNDSYCYAKDVKIDPLDVILDYGYKKHLTLKFHRIELLKPSTKVKLAYRVFDDDYEIEPKDTLNILNHFTEPDVEMKLNFKNIDGAPFKATVNPTKEPHHSRSAIPV